MDSLKDERLHSFFLEERKLAYWRGDLTKTEIDEYTALPNWSWYPSDEAMAIIASKVRKLGRTRGRPRKVSPTATDEEKKAKLKEKRTALHLKQLALEQSIMTR